MPLLAPSLVLIASTFFQLPAKPPMKMGLWESTVVVKMTMPGMNMPPGMGGRTTKVKSCMTPETYAQDLARQNQQRDCQVTNQNSTSTSISFDISCPRNNATGHFQMEWAGDDGHGTMHMSMDAGAHSMVMDSTMQAHYLGADCGSVKPGSPDVTR